VKTMPVTQAILHRSPSAASQLATGPPGVLPLRSANRTPALRPPARSEGPGGACAEALQARIPNSQARKPAAGGHPFCLAHVQLFGNHRNRAAEPDTAGGQVTEVPAGWTIRRHLRNPQGGSLESTGVARALISISDLQVSPPRRCARRCVVEAAPTPSLFPLLQVAPRGNTASHSQLALEELTISANWPIRRLPGWPMTRVRNPATL